MKKMSALLLGVACTITMAHAERYLIRGADDSEIKSEVKALGGKVHRKLKYFSGSSLELSPAQAAQLSQRMPHAIVQKEKIYKVVGKPGGGGTTSPTQVIPWSVNAIKAPEAHLYTKGAGVVVCIVDTGIQKNHPDLQANILGGTNFVVKKGSLDPIAWGDDSGHGTNVAGVVAAVDNTIGVVGVAPESKLFVVKALNSRGLGTESDVADGIMSCVSNGARVINLSIGGSQSSALIDAAIDHAVSMGRILVAAAGNSASAVEYPARNPAVIAVSAVNPEYGITYFSNFGPEIDFAAVGGSVHSTAINSSYATALNGTSFSAPQVSAVAALMLAAGKTSIKADFLSASPVEHQGQGFVNALRTVSE